MVTYNREKRQFEENGVVVETAVLLMLIGRLMDTTKREVRRVSIQLERGKITVEQWSLSVAKILRAAHITAASIGRGGMDKLTEKDWSRVEQTVTHQLGYLENFRNTILMGATVLAAGVIARRAAKYVAPIHASFTDMAHAAQLENQTTAIFARRITTAAESCQGCRDYAYEWMPIDEIPSIGSLQCGSRCRCYIEYR